MSPTVFRIPEVLNISGHGIWLLVIDKEYFLPFKNFPWFKEAKISDIQDIEFFNGYHLHWPKLDIDLDLDALENLEKYPLIYR